MIRKAGIILLSLLICLSSVVPLLAQPFTPQGRWATLQEYEKATGKTIGTFNEAPMLRTMVAAGELPPVSERLPEEPLVIKPHESIGKYGGSLNLLLQGPGNWEAMGWLNIEPFLALDREDATRILPNIAKGWELSSDAKTLTLYLRKGMKWSDGYPFGADDLLFWYNDICQNKELTPVMRSVWQPGGELMEMEKIDDYTVELEFAISSPNFLYLLAGPAQYGMQRAGIFVPAHYLKQFHIKYNPDADKLAKEEGYDHWYQLFAAKNNFRGAIQPEVELPVLGAWVAKVVAADHVTCVRNPYYFKIDTQGNQLPYIDQTKGPIVTNLELAAAKVFAGDPDFYAALDPSKLSVVMANADKNGYEVFVQKKALHNWPAFFVGLFFNHTVEDLFVRELFSNDKFKQALSLAINRDEINQLALKGLGEPTQATLLEPFYEERFGQAYAQYDPQKAKGLLAEIGLKSDEDGYILRPDGERLNLVIELAPWFQGIHQPATELIKDYWEKIGIKTSIDQTSGGEMWALYGANESQISMWVLDECDYTLISSKANWWSGGHFWGREWQRWFSTDGEEGIEPPADAKEFISIWEEIPYTMSNEEKISMGKRALELLTENLWMIGVARAPRIRVVRTSLGNVDLEHFGYVSYSCSGGFQWFFEE